MIRTEAEARDWIAGLPEWSDEAGYRLERLVRELADENGRQNLVSATSLREVWLRHIGDSAQLLRHVPRETRTWLDLGTGAGFPGLVVAIMRPDAEVHLVESRKRRVEWLEDVSQLLGLERVVVHGVRLEQLDGFPVDAISARAFAPLEKLLTLSARFSTSDTVWLLPKGRSAAQELDELRGWRHEFHVEQSLTDPEAGIIVGKLSGRKGKRS
ncbi:MAG: 16S rRNA (guanine(527)-N(7))-methyltransferase RsmG [Novosphingobium sp.]|nr:16S rRNA (guanine(527)-N(7))-methyltransferase RsmG [Novosphingobium sp.]